MATERWCRADGCRELRQSSRSYYRRDMAALETKMVRIYKRKMVAKVDPSKGYPVTRAAGWEPIGWMCNQCSTVELDGSAS